MEEELLINWIETYLIVMEMNTLEKESSEMNITTLKSTSTIRVEAKKKSSIKC